MKRIILTSLAILAFIQFFLVISLSPSSLAQEWALRVKPKGTLKVVQLWGGAWSAMYNYAEGLMTLDKNNNFAPCLAQDWRWIDDRTIEFKLRQGVTFHNGEKFNAEAVRVNWEAYKQMKTPRLFRFLVLPDETIFEITDEYRVRFTFPEPDGMAFVKFVMFSQIAPAFYSKYTFDENCYSYLPEAGPWGTGPFKIVEGSLRYAKPSDRVVLEAFEDYWDPRYPKVKRIIFDNTLIGNRREAMRLCREEEGAVDIVTYIRPLDTLKVAESKFAKVVKSRDAILLTGWFNQRKRDSKWRDIRLRKAVNYAINRKELWKYGARANAYNLGGSIPPAAHGHNPNLEFYTYDTTKARSLLAEAGYPKGFEVKIITYEAWKLEAQIIKRMLERIGLKVRFDVSTWSGYFRKLFIPILDKSPEEQDWDMTLGHLQDWWAHAGASWLPWYLGDNELRWNEYDPAYDEMWKDMARTVAPVVQGEKIRHMVQYLYDRAYCVYIYSPLSLYAVNKEANFVPEKFQGLRLKETSVTDKHWSVQREKK